MAKEKPPRSGRAVVLAEDLPQDVCVTSSGLSSTQTDNCPALAWP